MKARFEPDNDSGALASSLQASADSKPYDASEQPFAASLESRPELRRFTVECLNWADKLTSESAPAEAVPSPALSTPECAPAANNDSQSTIEAPHEQPPLLPSDGAWRQEVAVKVKQYRARNRVRAPRYPSLQLRFETPEPITIERPAPPPSPSVSRLAVAISTQAVAEAVPPVENRFVATEPAPHEAGGKIIEFPRFFATPTFTVDELAEPVLDRPRILEVPEQLPPPPALGGMLIEPKEAPTAERRPGFELPLNPPALSRRVIAAAIDAFIVAVSFAAFACIFFRVTGVIPPLKEAAGISAGLIAAFWVAHQFMFLTYSGTTPGLKLAKLQLSRFDGTVAPRSLRRWRILASVLSLLSLGLGYAWCFLDEDQLCWHDRITRTFMAATRSLQSSPTASAKMN